MDQIWLASPSPAMRLWPGRPQPTWRLNPAALSWGRGNSVSESAWGSVAAELSAVHLNGGARHGRLNRVQAHWRSLPMNTGWLVWLTDGEASSASASAPAAFSPWASVDERLALVQDIGRIGVFERDLITGAARWDDEVFRLLGFDPAAGVPPWNQAVQRIHPADVERFRQEHDRCLAEPGRHAMRFRIVLPGSGQERDLQIVAETRRDADGRPAAMVGAVVDDTDAAARVRAQQAVSDHFAKALQLAKVAVWRLDLDQRWIELNDVGFELLGQTPVAGGVSIDTIRGQAHPDDVEALANAAAEALAGDAVIDLETRYLFHGTPAYRRVLTRRVAERDAEGRAIGLLGVSLEQTERIAERERAQALAQRIQMVADTAGVGVYSVDLVSGAVEWNRQMFVIHGMPENGEALEFERVVAERVHPEDRPRFERRRLAGTPDRFEREVRIVHPDGSIRWVEYRSHHDRLGTNRRVLGIAIDVTERVLQRAVAERSLREKLAAEQANAAQSEFVARMSHDLRTPLNAVLGFAQLIEQSGDGVAVEVQRTRVGHIRQAGEELLSLIDDLLDRVQPQSLQTGTGTGTGVGTGTGQSPGDAASSTAGPGKPAAIDAPLKACRPLSVLYIEDNPVNVILVQQLVAMRAETRLHCAADGLTGVAWAAAERPDVVLVDMQLPDIDGFEVLRRLRGMRALDASAIVALSANGIAEDIALARAAGFDDYWTKPIDFRRFLSGLDHLAVSRCC